MPIYSQRDQSAEKNIGQVNAVTIKQNQTENSFCMRNLYNHFYDIGTEIKSYKH